MSENTLTEALRLHGLWTKGRDDGKRADLRRADLHGADLREADLRRAEMCGADLHETNLHRAGLHGANLDGTCLDPLNIPNQRIDAFERGSRYVTGWRTRTSLDGRHEYVPGRQYRAPVFSTADMPCHPGLYLWPSREACREFATQFHHDGANAEIVRVRSLAKNVHQAGDKWRTRHFLVLK